MKKNTWILQTTVVSLSLLGMAGQLDAHAGKPENGRGLIPPSKEDKEHFEKHVPKVSTVKHTKLGVTRIQEHRAKHGLPPMDIVHAEPDEEFSFVKPSSTETPEATTLPSSVDNSQLPSFPPIGDQGQQGSCVAWASTYYQSSHELGLLNGYDNKSSFTNVLSPKWTYNLLNGGADNGLIVQNAYGLLQANGAVSIVNFPYDGNYLAWDMNAMDWRKSILNRMGEFRLISGLGGNGTEQDLTNIKTALNNGHVVTFATFIDSWVFTTILQDPDNPNSPYTGQQAGSWMNGTDGGHCITIVGYDDDIWIDVNGNGQVDENERGAFLIANSWNTDWGNNGFIWISYDAFRAVSAVPNGPNDGRIPAGDALNNCVVTVVPKAAHYMPKLVAEFSLSQSQRNQIGVWVGKSLATQTAPNVKLAIPALQYQGGPYDFTGDSGGKVERAYFSFDLTDLLPSSGQTTDQRYYLVVNDNQTGHPTVLDSFVLYDIAHNKKVAKSALPRTFDHSTGTFYLEYNFQN